MNSLFLFAIAGNKTFYYIAAAALVLIVLYGISLMAKVETSVRGNRLGAVSMLLAVLLTLSYYDIFRVTDLWIGMLIGSLLGLYLSVKVKMIQMPQMVGLLNGFGGLASMIAGILSLIHPNSTPTVFSQITGGLAIVVGGLTWTGSAIAAAKLHKLISQRPKVHPMHQLWTTLLLAASLVCALLFALSPFQVAGLPCTLLILVTVILANLFGYFLAIRVGGADMPITISLLNSFSGVAGAIAGMAVDDLLLVAVGGVVGASGLLLTQIMCRAMNRHLMDILLGKTSAPAKKQAAAPAPAAPAAGSAPEKKAETPAQPKAASAAQWLKDATNVILVPGYGMALSQAQPLVKQLLDQLEADGKNVEFAIHPVAGRMPGHMNVLLAEVDVPYEKLHEMKEIDSEFTKADLALVIGANDVINPAANTAEGTPIYGMPVLSVADCPHILVMNFDLQPGYAGVENPLYKEAENSDEHVRLLLGDAKKSLQNLLSDYRKADAAAAAPAEAGAAASPEDQAAQWLKDATNVILVPGYGMALSQAQPLVKQLLDQLEADGKNVEFAIHPVAGRMPGHMNVLLAEVDVPYEKLHEMKEIDSDFKDADLALVIGANDVINPAANTAEGTPIYGMPVLSVADCPHIVVMNFDLQPGYAGVENPLYKEAENSNEHVRLLLGDAKQNLQALLNSYRRGPAAEAASAPATKEESPAGTAAGWLKDAKKIILVPGYGMALSQAQPLVKQLLDQLEADGKNIEFAIHPVAGRMPGHMNVLLAEVDVPYEKLHEMKEIDGDFKDADLALVIGANDVINPAANTAEGTPIYGMPVLSVADCPHIVVMNFDLQPGYAGVENPLYTEAQEGNGHVVLLLGDAKESLRSLLTKLRA